MIVRKFQIVKLRGQTSVPGLGVPRPAKRGLSGIRPPIAEAIDPTKNTGFLFPASKLIIDGKGESHYNFAGIPWALANVLPSKETPA